VKGVVDVNANRSADPREGFDTVRVASNVVARNDTAAAELYAFVRDTIGPRLLSVAPRDSLTLRVTFDKPLLPGQPLPVAAFRLVGADSVVVQLLTVLTAADYDSLTARRARASADSAARARPDTAARARAQRDSAARVDSLARAARDTSAAARRRRIPPPVPRRPTPSTDVVLTLREPLRPQTAYRLVARDLRSLAGVARTSERTFNTPRPEPARPAAPSPAADTTRAAPGTPPTGAPVTPPRAGAPAAPRDTTRRPPPSRS
jgi:hypothetical protein